MPGANEEMSLREAVKLLNEFVDRSLMWDETAAALKLVLSHLKLLEEEYARLAAAVFRLDGGER